MFASYILITAAFLGAALAVPLSEVPRAIAYKRNGSSAKVTSAAAFNSGAGNLNNNNTNDGTSKGSSSYVCYSGSWKAYPASSEWLSFDSMWSQAQSTLENGCWDTNSGDTKAQIQDIYNSIQQVAIASLVDHRYILATILQESSGCVTVSTENAGTKNAHPGLMQDEGGVEFVGNDASASAQASNILQMIVDGTQGTSSGDGLVQCINQYGNIYEAARCYNSGSVDAGNLNDAQGATASYVSDIGNWMTGGNFGSSSKKRSCGSN